MQELDGMKSGLFGMTGVAHYSRTNHSQNSSAWSLEHGMQSQIKAHEDKE